MKSIGIIGGGAMGGAFARGLVESGYDPALITVANPHAERVRPLADMGINTVTENADAARGRDLVVIAVKPWVLPGVAEQLRDVLDYDTQEVSVIVAGVSNKDLEGMLLKEGKLPCLSVAMPNTAMVLRESMTFLVPVNGPCPTAEEMLGRLGKVMVIEERLLKAGTALASCGIAYAMRYVRAAVEGGVQLGFRASDAQAIVVETLRGAAALLSQPGAHPESEIDKVTTPGGITIRGLNAMEREGFTNAVISGLTV